MHYIATHNNLKGPCPGSSRKDKAHVVIKTPKYHEQVVLVKCPFCDRTARFELVETERRTLP